MSQYLKCASLSKEFAGTEVLRGVSFALKRGECLALLGPSGCGKSTLLNILSGSLRPDSGEIICDGEILESPATGRHVPARKRNFAMVFQDFSLWPHMSVAENVAFGPRVRGVPGDQIRQRVQQALESVRMSDFATRQPTSLSGGQQQRVSIARALAVRPRLILLDEPLSALDAKLREAMRREIAGIIKETGLTAVYVTHDQAEAFTVGDRVALMNKGEIEQLDAPESLYKRPLTRFAADFLGAANLLEYKRQACGKAVVCNESLTLDLPADAPNSGWVMLRREDVLLLEKDDPDNGQVNGDWQGRCLMSEFLGDRLESEIIFPGGTRLRGKSHKRIGLDVATQAIFTADKLRFLKP